MTTTTCGKLFGKFFDRTRNRLAALLAQRGGNVTIIFALAMVPIFGAMGAAVDYSRANAVKAAMQAALDATALALAKEAAGLSRKQIGERASEIFSAEFRRPEARNVRVDPKYEVHNGAFTLTLAGSATVDAAFVRLLGVPHLTVSTMTQVMWGTKRIEVALVLDNTGSMAESGKIDALKRASHQLLSTLKSTSRSEGDVRLAIVPFDTHVNIGQAQESQPWIDWSLYQGQNKERVILTNASRGSPAGRNEWTGCIIDRRQSYDVSNTSPTSDPATFHPAVNCTLAPMAPLTSDWRALDQKVDQMKASGRTNLTIGLVWGWTMLTANAPLSTAVAPEPNLEKVIVFLTDGKNTENRWSQDAGAIDRRTEAVCKNVRDAGIKIYTIRVIEGNAALLRNCASKPEMYFEVRRASEIGDAFAAIARDLSNLHLAR